VAVPLLRGAEVIGTLSLGATEPNALTEQHLRLLETFADQAVIAIENARLFQELNGSNGSLREALEPQTPTADLLPVITQAPADLQRVVDAIAQTAARLGEADSVSVRRVEGDRLVIASAFGQAGREALAASRAGSPEAAVAVTRDHPTGRVMLDRQTVQVPDL